MLYVTRTKVNDSASLNDCTTENGQVNAFTMKDVVDACCNAKREDIIDVNTRMKSATTVKIIKELHVQHVTYANGKDETDLPRVPVYLAGTSRFDVGINTMVDTVTTPIAAIAIDIVQMKGKISHF